MHVVCEWIGNSATIAQKYYLQVTNADFEKATKDRAKDGAAFSSAALCTALQNPVRTVPDGKEQETTQPLELQGCVNPVIY